MEFVWFAWFALGFPNFTRAWVVILGKYTGEYLLQMFGRLT
jgi:hypothetical protein